MKNITIVVIGLMISNIAFCEYVSGNKLLADMKNKENFPAQGFARGYVVGVQDALEDILVCAPAQVTIGQLVDITERYLINNPDTRHQSGNVLVTRALSEKFPCKTAR